MPAQRRSFRIREVVFAVGMGALAAGGAAITLDAFSDDHSQHNPAGAGTSEINYPVMPFDQISTSGAQDIEITQGDTFSVRAAGSTRSLAQLEAVIEDGRLIIRPKPGEFRGNWGITDEATFYVTLPKLKALAIAGSGDVTIDRIESESFEATIGGNSEVEIGAITADEVSFSVAGSGSVIAAGTARQTRVSIAGSGEIQAGGLRSTNASVTIGGSGDVALTVDQEAKVSITGSGDVDISGPATCSVTRFGSGNVRCAKGGVED